MRRGAVANRMAEVTDESTDAFTMGELFGELGGELTRQNVSDITEALIEEGMDERTARKNARILWYVVKKGPVSALQTAMIEKNDVLAKAMREVGSEPSAAGGRRSEVSEWQRSKKSRKSASPKIFSGTATGD